MDTIHAPVYDERWGSYLNPTHERCVRSLVSRLAPGARVLDAACGTGKYWPILLQAGLEVMGVDQSLGMLRVAVTKHPKVKIDRLALQDLWPRSPGVFDAVLCIDALENIGPEDWPLVVAGLHESLRPGGAAYVTVELPEPDDERGQPDDPHANLVDGEVLRDGAYHYYPTIQRATTWLQEAGFSFIDGVVEGDGYAHFLMSG